jgi:putative N-acetylmuramoyl-L-alanine amidase
MNIVNSWLPISKYCRPGKKINPVKIAVHYVGNAGSSAKGNRNYFASGKVYASSHYIIGLEGEILRLIPEDEISYCTNQANGYTISIECCHPDNTGKFNSKTLNSLIKLCADICKRRGFNPLTDIIRHYDVTKKCCPAWWSPNGLNKNANSDFQSFRKLVKDCIDDKNIKKEDAELVSQGKLIVNGKEYKIDRILKDSSNYIKADNFKNMGFEVGYDKNTKAVVLNNKPKEINLNDIRVKTINVEGSNYVNIRDIAAVLSMNIDYKDNGIIMK